MLKNVSKLILSAVLFLCPAVLCLGYPYDSLDIDAPALGKHDGGGGGGNQVGGYSPNNAGPSFGIYFNANSFLANSRNRANAPFVNEGSEHISVIAKSFLGVIPNALAVTYQSNGFAVIRTYLADSNDGTAKEYNPGRQLRLPFIAYAGDVPNYCHIDYSITSQQGNAFPSPISCLKPDGRSMTREYMYKSHPSETAQMQQYIIPISRKIDLYGELLSDLSKFPPKIPIIAFFYFETPVSSGVIGTNLSGILRDNSNLTYKGVAQAIGSYNVQALVLGSCLSMNFDNLNDLSTAKNLRYVIASPYKVAIQMPNGVSKTLGAESDWGGKTIEETSTKIVNGYTDLYRLLPWVSMSSKVSIANMGYFSEAKEALEDVLQQFVNLVNDGNRFTIIRGIYDSVYFYDRFTDKKTPLNSYSGYAADIGSLLTFIQTTFPNLAKSVEIAKDRIRALVSSTSQNKRGDNSDLLNISLLLPEKAGNEGYRKPIRGFNPKVEALFNKIGLRWD